LLRCSCVTLSHYYFYRSAEYIFLRELTMTDKIEKIHGPRIDKSLIKGIRSAADFYDMSPTAFLEGALAIALSKEDNSITFTDEAKDRVIKIFDAVSGNISLPEGFEGLVKRFDEVENTQHQPEENETGRGVIFDTCASHYKDAIWEMLEGEKISAYGSSSYFATHLNKGDTVFFYHAGVGIIAAAEVISDAESKNPASKEEKFCKIKFITAIPKREEGIKACIKARRIRKITQSSFFWSRTIKLPYLNRTQTQDLLEEAKKVIGTV